LVASYEGIRWTQRFTWFGPPERNNLCPRVNGVVLLCLSARLRSSLLSLCVRACPRAGQRELEPQDTWWPRSCPGLAAGAGAAGHVAAPKPISAERRDPKLQLA
jgi:hypothetical protein